jgi:hypothetical protein
MTAARLVYDITAAARANGASVLRDLEDAVTLDPLPLGAGAQVGGGGRSAARTNQRRYFVCRRRHTKCEGWPVRGPAAGVVVVRKPPVT